MEQDNNTTLEERIESVCQRLDRLEEIVKKSDEAELNGWDKLASAIAGLKTINLLPSNPLNNDTTEK